MKHQMLSILTSLSVAFAPLTALADKKDGSGPPKNNCDPEMVDQLWRSEDQKLKDKFQAYYLTPKKEREVSEEEFCEQLFTEAGFCADGKCKKGSHKAGLDREDGRAIKRAAEQGRDEDYVEPRYRGGGERVVEKVVYRDRPVDNGGGGGFGNLFNGNPMGYMLAGGLGGLIGAMMAGNNNRQQMMGPPMFRSPYGPYGPMGPGGMGPGMMNRPPPYLPYNGFGGAPGIIGAGGGAPGMIGGNIPYNGANIYNAGYGGGFTSNYFNSAPAVINASTGMRMYSVGGAAPAPQYRLLGN